MLDVFLCPACIPYLVGLALTVWMIGDCGGSQITGKFLRDILSTFIHIRALSGVMSTMYSSVEARGRDIATLRAIGFGEWAAFAGTIVEASTLATMGGMLGTLSMLVVLHSFRISIVGGNVSQTIISLTLDAWIIVQGFNMAIAIGVLGGILPALASAKEDVAATFGR